MPPRARLVYVAREWGRLSGQELGGRLQRDPSIIGRLTALDAAYRDLTAETLVVRDVITK